MTKFRTTAIALALVAGAAAGVTGCSGKEAPKAKDAWNKAQDTLGTYKSLEIRGDGTSDGKPATVTVKGDVSGTTMALDAKIGSGAMNMLTAGSKNYLRADEAFFTQASQNSALGDADPKKFANHWVELPTAQQSSNTGFQDFIKQVKDDSSAMNKKLLSDKATVAEDKVDGKDAWKITSEDKKATVWVSQDDGRDILKTEGLDLLQSSGATGSQDVMRTITFVSHDKDYGIKAPSGAVNLQELMGGSSK